MDRPADERPAALLHRRWFDGPRARRAAIHLRLAPEQAGGRAPQRPPRRKTLTRGVHQARHVGGRQHALLRLLLRPAAHPLPEAPRLSSRADAGQRERHHAGRDATATAARHRAPARVVAVRRRRRRHRAGCLRQQTRRQDRPRHPHARREARRGAEIRRQWLRRGRRTRRARDAQRRAVGQGRRIEEHMESAAVHEHRAAIGISLQPAARRHA